AYLFHGARGVGKTTMARILAKALNCADGPTSSICNTCEHCLEITEGRSTDVIEIDAASNRGIDNIRELRAQAVFAPMKSRYKVYIIDEVHMLTTEAFNALLKTLEEPPNHVVFIMATTELHKVPETIVSRCQ
ncbi:MAG TPA: DNA polymerase III subunit gamma/tau, partial [Turneriella sp.]|nr:DNA polymerase III subunit gamma/tau [Turneriella sp.]